jgi:hypothetical protein
MTTEERLTTLEQELAATRRRFRWLLVGLALGLGALALVWVSAASAPKAKAQVAAGGQTVRASEFVLEDENGKVRAILSVFKDVPGLSLFDEDGKNRVGLVVDKDGPRLSLYDENGKPRAVLAVVGKAGSGLVLFDAADKAIWSAP